MDLRDEEYLRLKVLTSYVASRFERKTDQLSIPVGTRITVRPPDKTERAQFGHSASTLGA